MKYLALYRKYRPKSLDDMVGQDEIVTVIKNAIISNKISHAYLFSGPRGTGKTSTAKIIARMVNCLEPIDGNPCGKCVNCLDNNSNDIIEIDAASNNGVDEIRELRDKINLVPSNGKYKIYIVDEVHMLTIQAFNALLKTLEEPPSHIIFILATTELDKIPPTVSSRCQKFNFCRISNSEIAKRLTYIANNEEIDISLDAIYEIARVADGGLRDAINLLDELSVYKNGRIELNDVNKISGAVSYEELSSFLSYMVTLNRNKIIEFFEELFKNGKNINSFIDQMILLFKDILIYKNCGILTEVDEKNNLIKEYSDKFSTSYIFMFINDINELKIKINNSDYVNILCIVTMLKLLEKISDSKTINNLVDNTNEKRVDVKASNDNKEKNIEQIRINDAPQKKYDKKMLINNLLALADKKELINFSSNWNRISEFLLEEKFRVIVGLLNDVKPVVVSQKSVMFSTKFDSICERLNDNIEIVSELLFKLYMKKYDILFVLDSEWNAIKNDYINRIKSGYKYKYIELSSDDNSIYNNSNSDYEKLISIIDIDKIEIK